MDGDDGVDRPFGDLPDMPIVLNHTQPVSVCARLCLNNSQCASWAYSKAGCGDSTTPYCYLKGVIPKQSYNPCRVGKLTYVDLLGIIHNLSLSAGIWC